MCYQQGKLLLYFTPPGDIQSHPIHSHIAYAATDGVIFLYLFCSIFGGFCFKTSGSRTMICSFLQGLQNSLTSGGCQPTLVIVVPPIIMLCKDTLCMQIVNVCIRDLPHILDYFAPSCQYILTSLLILTIEQIFPERR